MYGVSHYKIIFLMVGRFDLMMSNSEYTNIIRYAVDSIRENSKVVIAMCPSIVQPADVPAQRIEVQGRSMTSTIPQHIIFPGSRNPVMLSSICTSALARLKR